MKFPFHSSLPAAKLDEQCISGKNFSPGIFADFIIIIIILLVWSSLNSDYLFDAEFTLQFFKLWFYYDESEMDYSSLYWLFMVP